MKPPRLILWLSIAISLFYGIQKMDAKESTVTQPDFAFPQKVSTQAEKDLKTALRKSDGPATVRALLDLGLAQACIDNDNLTTILSRIDNLRADNRTASDTRAMLALLEASIYQQIYTADKFKYNKRSTPATPLPDNYDEWSGEQFRSRIECLVDTALSDDNILKSEPLSQWAAVITAVDADAKCFPTLYDFVAYQAIELLSDQQLNSLFPQYWLCRYSTYTQMTFRYTSPTAKKILDIYKNLITLHADNADALIFADVSRIAFIKRYIADDNSAETTRFELLMELYAQYSDHEFAGYILQQAGSLADTEAQQRRLYDAIVRYVDSHTQTSRWSSALNSIKASLTRKSVSANYRCSIIPGGALAVTVSSHNAASTSVGLYRLPDTPTPDNASTYRYDGKGAKPTLVESRAVNFSHSHPIFTADSSLTFTVPTVGRYVIMPLLSGSDFPTNTSAAIIRCTSIALLSGINAIVATDPITGSPLGNVDLQLMSYRNETMTSTTTNADGWAQIPVTGHGYYIRGSKGDDNVSVCGYRSWTPTENSSWNYHSKIYTDLPIYHPGGSVRFVAIVYRRKAKTSQLSAGTKVTARLWNANRQQVDSISLTTDRFGRAESRFAIPSDGLTGSFRISVERAANEVIANRSFTVSDYKLPSFEINDLQTECSATTVGDITVTGHAVTYSDFALAAADVTLDLAVAQRFRWNSGGDRSFYSTTATTDADGRFCFVLPDELLKNAPIANGVFTANITVTSATGESQTAAISFSPGPDYSIEASLPDNLDIANGAVTLPVRAIDALGKAVDIDISYSLIANGAEQKSGILKSTAPTVDWSTVPSGCYRLTLSIDTDTVAIDDLSLYRPSDKMPPVDTPLWVPVTDMSAPRGSVAKILYGTSNPTAHILAVVSDNDSIISRQWLSPKPGNHTLNVTIPKSGESLLVSLSTVSDYTMTTKTVTITATDVARNLNVTIDSFRDRIIPGNNEQWTISVTDNLGSPQSSAVILDMYAKALDRLATADWRFFVDGYYKLWRFNLRAPQAFTNRSTAMSADIARLSSVDINCPQWQLYDRSFTSSTSFLSSKLRIRGAAQSSTMLYATSRANIDAGTDTTVDECADNDMSTDNDEAADKQSTDKQSTDNYRMPEMPIALFEPMLTTDANGRLCYSFTAPNANTTWQLCALALSRDLITGNFCHEIIANKPVMVQPNMPRFLRSGDHAVIQAAVMNNTDSTMAISSRIEIFDPATGNIIDTHHSTDTIDGLRSAIIAINVTAPTDNTLLGFRIRSQAGLYSDGEQSLIAILPSSTPVINSHPFYMAPSDTQMSIILPQMPDNARITLQFCQNPAWYCVTALPGLISNDARSALSASAAIFSAAVANGLLKSQPELRKALQYWSTSDKSDSTLISMLDRNQDLKTVLLNATPWMMDARSQTERMTRLALLFDRNEIANVYNQNIGLLAKLQRGKGGWCWTEHATEPSPWITYRVLELMGRLKQLGWLPDNKQLGTMIETAVAYIDDCNAREFVRNPKADYSQYVSVRDYYTDIKQSTAAKRVSAATVQNLISDWKDRSVTGKALAALILNNHGYNATARQVLASLREYAKYKPESGMWWQSLNDNAAWSMGAISGTATVLNAFATVDPGCSDIDMIRQWLIIQKEAKDWGSAVSTSDAIAAILTSGSRWTVPAHEPQITIGKHAVEPSRSEALTGYFRTDISDTDPSLSVLSISKTKAGPAWGAVYSQYIGEMTEVEAQACEELAIEKQLFVQRANADGCVWVTASDVAVGDRIKVQLTIRANRDIDYVAIIDDRAAALEPIEQLPSPIFSEGICFYRENRDSSTRMFVSHMPKGTYLLSYELFANNAGSFASGIASIQSQYAPQFTAHSAGCTLSIR